MMICVTLARHGKDKLLRWARRNDVHGDEGVPEELAKGEKLWNGALRTASASLTLEASAHHMWLAILLRVQLRPSMEGRASNKRKRVSQNTACAACVRHHRACDKSLPCTRCIEKGVAHLCATPIKAPRFIYANVAADTFTGKRCTRRPQAQVSHTTSEGATRSQKEKDRAQLLVTILRDVRRLNEATTALERQQDTFKRQLSALRAGGNHCTPTISATESASPESNSQILQDNPFAESAFLPFVIDDPLKVALPYASFTFCQLFLFSLLWCSNRLCRIGICSTVLFGEALKGYSMTPTPVLPHSQGSRS